MLGGLGLEGFGLGGGLGDVSVSDENKLLENELSGDGDGDGDGASSEGGFVDDVSGVAGDAGGLGDISDGL